MGLPVYPPVSRLHNLQSIHRAIQLHAQPLVPVDNQLHNLLPNLPLLLQVNPQYSQLLNQLGSLLLTQPLNHHIDQPLNLLRYQRPTRRHNQVLVHQLIQQRNLPISLVANLQFLQVNNPLLNLLARLLLNLAQLLPPNHHVTPVHYQLDSRHLFPPSSPHQCLQLGLVDSLRKSQVVNQHQNQVDNLLLPHPGNLPNDPLVSRQEFLLEYHRVNRLWAPRDNPVLLHLHILQHNQLQVHLPNQVAILLINPLCNPQ